MSALDALFRHEVEAERAVVAVDELVQRRVGRRALRRIAELQDVLGGVLRAEVEVMRRPFLDGPHAGAGREFACSAVLSRKWTVVLMRLQRVTWTRRAVLEVADRLVALARARAPPLRR